MFPGLNFFPDNAFFNCGSFQNRNNEVLMYNYLRLGPVAEGAADLVESAIMIVVIMGSVIVNGTTLTTVILLQGATKEVVDTAGHETRRADLC